MGAADWTVTFLSLLNWVSRFRQGIILIRYAKLAVGLHLCRNHFAYSFGLREFFSRHFGLHDPSFFLCPHFWKSVLFNTAWYTWISLMNQKTKYIFTYWHKFQYFDFLF